MICNVLDNQLHVFNDRVLSDGLLLNLANELLGEGEYNIQAFEVRNGDRTQNTSVCQYHIK